MVQTDDLRDGEGPARVLFIDDERSAVDGIRRSLRSLGVEWDCLFTTEPAEILAAVEASAYCVVVSDWMMPGMDGLGLCARVRQLTQAQPRRAVCFILLTGKQTVEDAVYALDVGADDYVRKPFDPRELVARIRVGLRVIDTERRLHDVNARLETLAITDPLTALLNRRRCREILDAEMARVSRGKQELSVLLADVDHFKRINDVYGHDAGDAVLQEIAARMSNTFRQYDSVCRWGGEEFVVICPHTTAVEASAAAERLRLAVCERALEIASLDLRLACSLSIGSASSDSEPRCDSAILISRADKAMYAAKAGGRNRVVTWTEVGLGRASEDK